MCWPAPNWCSHVSARSPDAGGRPVGTQFFAAFGLFSGQTQAVSAQPDQALPSGQECASPAASIDYIRLNRAAPQRRADVTRPETGTLCPGLRLLREKNSFSLLRQHVSFVETIYCLFEHSMLVPKRTRLFRKRRLATLFCMRYSSYKISFLLLQVFPVWESRATLRSRR